jgi:hypothetical protein
MFGVPSALLRNDSTITMRVKAVIISRMDGATDSRVRMARICSEVETSCGVRAAPTSTLTRGMGTVSCATAGRRGVNRSSRVKTVHKARWAGFAPTFRSRPTARMNENPLLKVPPASRGNQAGALSVSPARRANQAGVQIGSPRAAGQPHALRSVPLAKRGEPAGGGQSLNFERAIALIVRLPAGSAGVRGSVAGAFAHARRLPAAGRAAGQCGTGGAQYLLERAFGD